MGKLYLVPQIRSISKSIIFSSARRYLRFGSPVFRKYAAADWTFKKTGHKDLKHHGADLQKIWQESLAIDEPNVIDGIITLYFAYLDITNYNADKLIEKLFEFNIISDQRPVKRNFDDENYLRTLLKDNAYDDKFLVDDRLAHFTFAEKFYISLMMSFPLPWACLANELKVSDNFQTKPNRFLRLIKLVDYLCLNIEESRSLFDMGQARLDLKSKNIKATSQIKVSLDDLKDMDSLFLELSEISSQSRIELQTPLPEKMVLLVEGNTEQIALPHLAKCMGIDFNKHGLAIICVGGKNQMLKQFMDWVAASKLPLRVILDSDAEEQIEAIQAHLREQDKLFVIKEGEFEDSFELDSLIDLANQILVAGQPLVEPGEFEPGARRTVELDKIWRRRGLGNFDKVAFANAVVDYVENESQVPASLKRIIEEMI